MKRIVITALAFSFLTASAQNVGVGTSTPAEKLDVNGNINVTGTIKTNGADGTPNQVLMKNSSGALVWGDAGEYKNFVSYRFTTVGATQTWVVPANVTKILVELWSGGGGGNSVGGGAGAPYIRTSFPVVAGQNVDVTVGGGGAGNGGTANAGNGGSSFITTVAGFISIAGGKGATATAAGDGGLSGVIGTSGNPPYILVQGESGEGYIDSYGQSASTTFLKMTAYGRGGNGGNAVQSGGTGSFATANAGTGTVINSYNPVNGLVMGGGGGSGINGANGGNGMVIIYY